MKTIKSHRKGYRHKKRSSNSPRNRSRVRIKPELFTHYVEVKSPTDGKWYPLQVTSEAEARVHHMFLSFKGDGNEYRIRKSGEKEPLELLPDRSEQFRQTLAKVPPKYPKSNLKKAKQPPYPQPKKRKVKKTRQINPLSEAFDRALGNAPGLA